MIKIGTHAVLASSYLYTTCIFLFTIFFFFFIIAIFFSLVINQLKRAAVIIIRSKMGDFLYNAKYMVALLKNSSIRLL